MQVRATLAGEFVLGAAEQGAHGANDQADRSTMITTKIVASVPAM